ncbi:hypothetical protein PsYK624_105060 [Phanerochaete sordida]|uniref:Uncharacterized protein n=1 Tax=Phanerochaete sordida TaxID=48140 RepID=A0A9P3GG84_9APHY|nr:hypothetical protein PsYK624_105060 [Phanerochaete sordida]
MDELVKDNPEMAFELLRMMNEKQRRTALELEQTRQDNEALRATVARLEGVRSGAGGEQFEGTQNDELISLRSELERERDINKRILGDNTDLKALVARTVDGEDAHGKSRSASGSPSTECPPGCKSRSALLETQSQLEQRILDLAQHQHTHAATIAAHERHIAALEDAAQNKELEYDTLQCCVDELEHDLKHARKALDEQRARAEGMQQLWHSEKELLGRTNFELRRDLELYKAKYQKYKALATSNPNAMQIDTSPTLSPTPLPTPPMPNAPSAPPPTPPTQNAPLPARPQSALPTPPPTATPEAEPRALAPPNIPPVSSSAPEGSAQWRSYVARVLARPCFPAGEAGAPFELPDHARKHLAGAVVDAPHRLLFPAAEGVARLLAPALCGADAPSASTAPGAPSQPIEPSTSVDSSPPTESAPPEHQPGTPNPELTRHLHAAREIFAYTPAGVCYVGTFRGVRVVELAPAEVRALGEETQDALLREAYPSGAAAAGTPRVHALELVWEGFNRPLADALHARTRERSPFRRGASTDRRRSRSLDRGRERSRSPPPRAWFRARSPFRRGASIDRRRSRSLDRGRGRSRSPMRAWSRPRTPPGRGRLRTRSPPRAWSRPRRSRTPPSRAWSRTPRPRSRSPPGRPRRSRSPPSRAWSRPRSCSPPRRSRSRTPRPASRERSWTRRSPSPRPPPRPWSRPRSPFHAGGERTRDPRPRPPRAGAPAGALADRPADLPKVERPRSPSRPPRSRSRAASTRARSRGRSRMGSRGPPAFRRTNQDSDGRMEDERSDELSAVPMRGRGSVKRAAEGGAEGGRGKGVRRE